MKKSTKIALVIASVLVIVGLMITLSALSMMDWDLSKLNTTRLETKAYQIDEEFASILIETDTADIRFSDSEDGECKIVCYEQINVWHEVSVSDGRLTIKTLDERKWYEHIGIFIEQPSITIYLPIGEYGDLLIEEDTGDISIPEGYTFESIDIGISTGDVKSRASANEDIKIAVSTGNIDVKGISAKSIDLTSSTGKSVLKDIECESIVSKGSTGDIHLTNVIAHEYLSLNRSTGDVILTDCDAGEIVIKTDTGDVTGSLLSEKVFITQTDTGDIDVPKCASGERCEIVTDTGDIKITVD